MDSYQAKATLDIVGAGDDDSRKFRFPPWDVVVSFSPSPWPLGEILGLVCQTGRRRRFDIVPLRKALS